MKKNNECVDCRSPCYGERCKRCSNVHKALINSRCNNIDVASLVIDAVNFNGHDANGIKLPVKMKFTQKCVMCPKQYAASLISEREKEHPWHCKSCAIKLEWKKPAYAKLHGEMLRAAVTPAKRARLSVISKRNWQDDTIRRAMLSNRDYRASAQKAAATRHKRLLAGVVYRTTHGKRIICNGVWMRSTYEVRFANAMMRQMHDWTYEPKWFELSSGKLYLPDFYVPKLDLFVEVKGWWRDDAREKFDAFIEEYSHLRCALVMKQQLESIECGEMSLEACIIT